MSKYQIRNVYCDVTDGGMACGPVPGHVVATVEVYDGTKVFFLTEVEVEGTPNFYYTEENKFNEFLAEDFDDDEWCDYMDDHYITEYDGFEITDYDDIVDSFVEEMNDTKKLIKYIIAVVRMDFDVMKEFISNTVGKDMDDIEIPVLDIED